MKVPTQKFSAVGVHPPSASIDSSHPPCSINMRRVCQLHVEQLGTQLPVVVAGIVYQDTETGKRQSVTFYNQEQASFKLDLSSYIDSEVWLIDSLPVLSLSEVVLVDRLAANVLPLPQDAGSFHASIAAKLATQRASQLLEGIKDSGDSLSCHSIYLSSEPKIQDEHEESNLKRLFAYVCVLQHADASDSNKRVGKEYLLLCTSSPLSQEQQRYAEQHAEIVSHYLALWRESYHQRTEIQLLEQVVQRAEHQLRNPLALIGLYAENLCRSLPAGSLQEQATIVRETANELSAKLTDLIHCGQQAKLNIAPDDLRMILLESIKGLQPWLEQKQLCISYPPTSCNLALDRWQMKQVFDNLLSNAVHFSPQSSTITCNWQVFAQEVLVEVRDRGPGLSQEDLKQAFTPFYSRRPGGTGLGLAIAKKIVLDHRGSLWVENIPGGGAQFSFILPRK